jgi:hypothetical protein
VGWWTRFCLIAVVALSASASVASAQGYGFPEQPADRGFITDGANLISASDDAAIREIADLLLTDKAVP